MALIDFLFNKGANKLYNDMEAVENYADMQKAEALKSKLKPVLVPLQMDATGGLDAEATNRVQNYINNPVTEPNLWQKIVGRDVTTDTQTINPETNEITLGSSRVHEPGYLEKAGQGLKRGLNDILGGYGENRTQGFSTDNWNNNYLDNGNKKGLAYKLGEGLGSFAKLAESPLGRSLLVGGIVGASGGSGLEALSYGAQTGMLNQANRMKDQMYRNSLIESAKSSIMGSKLPDDEKARQIAEVTNRINSYRGYVGDDTYKQILAGMQLKDNAEYKNALLASNLRNQQELMDYRRMQLDRQARQDAIDTDIAYQNLGLKKKELEQKGNTLKPLSDSQVEKITTAQDTIEALENIESRYSNPKYKNAFGLSGAARTQFAKDHPLLYAPFDNEITLVRQDIDMLRQNYAKAMEGGRMSDSDRAFYQNVLMSQNLSYENFLEGVKRLKASEQKSLGRRIANYGMQGKDVSEFEKYAQQTQERPQEGNSKRDEIINKLRNANYTEEQIAEYLKAKGY